MSGIPSYPVISAQPEFDWLTPMRCFVRCGAAQNIALPDVAQIDTEFKVVDNLGLASVSNPLTIYVRLFGGVISAPITVAGGMLRFTWTGSFFAIG